MRKNLLAFPVTAVLLLSIAGATYGHHGIASSFDMTRTVTVKGTVTSFEWTNPHAYIYLDAKDEKGAVEKWRVEMGSVGMLARYGWRRDTLKAGDEITASGKRAKDGKPMMVVDNVVLADGQELSATDLPVPLEGVPAPKH